MNIEPLPVAAVPHPGLLRLAGTRAARGVHELREPDVGDARGVLTDEVHMGVEQGGVNGLVVLAQQVFKVELMKVHAFHQVSQSFRFERGESRITNPRVGFKISIVDRFNQLLGYLDYLLFTGLLSVAFSSDSAAP